jgi:hypothetical protein
MKKISIIFFAFIIMSCENSIEEQQSAWESNKVTVENYKTKYPYLAEKIEAQYVKAKENMERANNISNERKRIKTMRIANMICKHGPIEEIKRFEKAIESLKSQIKSVKEDFGNSKLPKKTAALLEKAEKNIKYTDLIISAKYSSADSALLIFADETNKLDEIERSLKKYHKRVLKKHTEDSSKDSGIYIPVEKKSKASNTNVEKIKCDNCGSLINKGDTICKYCGAHVKGVD